MEGVDERGLEAESGGCMATVGNFPALIGVIGGTGSDLGVELEVVLGVEVF